MIAARVRLLILCALILAEARRAAEERRRVEWADNDSDLARWEMARAEGLV